VKTALPIPRSHTPTVELLSKAAPRRRAFPSDQRISGSRQARAPSELSHLAQTGNAMVQSRLFRTRRNDPDVYGMLSRLRSRVPEHRIVESEGFEGKGDDATREGLLRLFHRPDGQHSYRQLLSVSVDRLKCIGSAHWLLRRAEEVREQLGQRVDVLAKDLLAEYPGLPTGVLSALCNSFARELSKQVETRGDSDVVGFEVMYGYVCQHPKDETKYVQTVGSGMRGTQEFEARDVVEFIRLDPETGRPLGALATLEAWSDASIWAFLLNRDSARTGAMADRMIAIEGLSDAERSRIEGLMLYRADPTQTDKGFIPMLLSLQASFEGRAPVIHDVELSNKSRDAGWIEWDRDVLKKRKGAVTGVPLPLVDEWQTVNRASLDAYYQLLIDFEWWPLFCDLNDPINDRILQDELGVQDWIHEFVEPDLRSSEERFRQDMEQMGAGLRTPYAMIADEEGAPEADRIIADLDARGLDGGVLKLPWFKTGKGWQPITEVVGRKGEPPPTVGAQDLARQMQGKPGPSLNDPNAEPDEEQPPPELEKQLAALDAWQTACNEALSKGLDPGTAWPDEVSVYDIEERHLRDVDARLTGAETKPEVSDAFAPARRALRDGLKAVTA